jgi:hypothetical protein
VTSVPNEKFLRSFSDNSPPNSFSPQIENTLAKMPHVATQGRPGIAMVTLS